MQLLVQKGMPVILKGFICFEYLALYVFIYHRCIYISLFHLLPWKLWLVSPHGDSTARTHSTRVSSSTVFIISWPMLQIQHYVAAHRKGLPPAPWMSLLYCLLSFLSYPIHELITSLAHLTPYKCK